MVCRRCQSFKCLKLQRKKREPKKEKKKSKVAGWPTENMEEKASTHEFNDTEEMVQWRSLNQEGINNVWKKLSENGGIYKVRGEPSE